MRRPSSLTWLLFAKRHLQATSIVCRAVLVGLPVHSAQCLLYIGNVRPDVSPQPLLSISIIASTGFGRPTVKQLVFYSILFYPLQSGVWSPFMAHQTSWLESTGVTIW